MSISGNISPVVASCGGLCLMLNVLLVINSMQRNLRSPSSDRQVQKQYKLIACCHFIINIRILYFNFAISSVCHFATMIL